MSTLSTTIPATPMPNATGTETQSAPMVEVEPFRELRFTYRNWRGEVAERRVSGGSAFMVFASSEWHPEPQWLMTAYDLDKDGFRDFAWKDILHLAPATLADETLRAEVERLTKALEEMTAIKDIHAEKRHEQFERAEAAEAKLAALSQPAPVIEDRNAWKTNIEYVEDLECEVSDLKGKVETLEEELSAFVAKGLSTPHPDQTSPMTVGPEAFLEEPAPEGQNAEASLRADFGEAIDPNAPWNRRTGR